MAISTAGTNARREAIRAMLATRAGSADDASALAQASVDTWRQVTFQLAPVIGVGGVEVLFNRAIHQTSAVFPWLATAVEDGGGDALLSTLEARFEGQETTTVGEASATVLLNFAELLATLIGESLTDRLLGPVWAPVTPASEREIP